MTDQTLRATIRYLIASDEKPIYIASTPGADAALNIGAQFQDIEVDIYDARQRAVPSNLDQQGFTLVKHLTCIENFYQLESNRQRYEEEISSLVQKTTGATQTVVFDHTLRSDSRDIRGQRSTREPAAVIHNDYTDASARQRLSDLLPQQQAAIRLQQRFAIINVWRSINGPIINSPLACCDATTLATQDLIASERRAAERIGELELVSWNPAHCWYYYPAMQFDEALLIKTYDSATDGRARRSVHTAFENPRAPADAPPRESIESRLLVFFD